MLQNPLSNSNHAVMSRFIVSEILHFIADAMHSQLTVYRALLTKLTLWNPMATYRMCSTFGTLLKLLLAQGMCPTGLSKLVYTERSASRFAREIMLCFVVGCSNTQEPGIEHASLACRCSLRRESNCIRVTVVSRSVVGIVCVLRTRWFL